MVGLRIKFPPIPGGMDSVAAHPRFAELDPWVQRAFGDDDRPVEARYRDLFRYFVAGFLTYQSNDGARAFYPGAPSVHGRAVEGREGFSRLAPLVAAWLHGGRALTLSIPEFGDVDLVALLRDALVAGTDPASDAYWGDFAAGDQRVLEALDIALAVWLTRDLLWHELSAMTQERIATWLAQAEGGATQARLLNWRLAPMVVNRVLHSLGRDVRPEAFAADWAAVWAGYAGGGWFRDRETLGFDYYNAWSFHYALYWLTRIDPGFDDGVVREARREFVAFYRHFMTPAGLPMFGRSICYRTAAPAPLVIAAGTDPDVVAPGVARRALDRVWRYFVAHGAVADGGLTQGYCGADMRLLDRYSGPASCLWGLRSLVVAFAHPSGAAFWSAPEAPLPVERGDFDLTDADTGIRVTGTHAAGEVRLYLPDASTEKPRLKPYRRKHRVAEWIFQRPFRPPNRDAKYRAPVYTSAAPIGGCTAGMVRH